MENPFSQSMHFSTASCGFDKTLTPSNKPQSFLAKSQVTHGSRTIKGQSRLEYYPYEKKTIQYENVQVKAKVPVIQRSTIYGQRKTQIKTPKQVTQVRWIPVQKKLHYVKEVIPQKRIEMVPVQKKHRRTQYIPINRQTIHYPESGLGMKVSRHLGESILSGQGFKINSNAQFKPMSSNLIYQFSKNSCANSKIIYHDNGVPRSFGNTLTVSDAYCLDTPYSTVAELNIPKSEELIIQKPVFSKEQKDQKTENTDEFN